MAASRSMLVGDSGPPADPEPGRDATLAGLEHPAKDPINSDTQAILGSLKSILASISPEPARLS
jgi:hypothetical protein